MTPDQESKMLALLERIANATEQQASDTQAIKSQIHSWVQSFPVHLRDLYAFFERRK
ncbi:MAG: hypothetical protein AAB403_13400 [Planctomycetota bacterium]